jgi:hypothetical protein
MIATTHITRAFNAVLSLLFLPGRVVEEGLHTTAAWPFADSIRVEFRPGDGTAWTDVEFRAGTPAWAIRLVHLAPEAVAAIAAVATISWWGVGGSLWWPATTTDWALLSLLGAQYLAIAIPSSQDLDHTSEADA